MSESNPIVVLAYPRTGSSMVSRIIEKHGFFVGRDSGINSRCPTGNAENLNLKDILIDMHGTGIHLVKEFVPGFRERILNAIKSEGYSGGEWLAKHAAAYWKVWGEFEPRYINIKRNRESTLISNTISGMSGRHGKELVHALDVNLEQMDFVHKEYGAPYVDTDEVIAGDYFSLEKALNHYGIEFDPDIADTVVDRRHWHY